MVKIVLLIIFLVLTYCDCPNMCSCYDNRCNCELGYTGYDCSLRTCVEGKSWSGEYKLCSGHGSCDELTGECRCNPGFDGFDCSRTKCPEFENKVCGGRGLCLNSVDYAKHFLTRKENSTVNNPTFENVTAYSVPNTDISGCLCDSGFSGYDCSDIICPVGGVDNKGNYRKAVIEPSNGDTFFPSNVQSLTIRIASCDSNSASAICRYADVILSKSLRENDIRNLIRTSGVVQDIVVKLYKTGGTPPTTPPTTDNFIIENEHNATQLNLAKYIVLYFVTDNNAYVVSTSSYKVTHSFVKISKNADKKSIEITQNNNNLNNPVLSYNNLVINKICSGFGRCNKQKGVCECALPIFNYDNYTGLLSDIKILNCQLSYDTLQDTNENNKNSIENKISCESGSGSLECGFPTPTTPTTDNIQFHNCQPYCKCDDGKEGITCDETIYDDSTTKWFGLSNKTVCSNMGKMNSENKCVCMNGFSGDTNYGYDFTYFNGTICNNHGEKNQNTIFDGKLNYYDCTCDKGYRGSNCSEAYCVYGLDPYEKVDTTADVSPKITFTTTKKLLTYSFSQNFVIKINGNSITITINESSICNDITNKLTDIKNIKCSGSSLTDSSPITLEFQSACNEDFDIKDVTGGDVEMKFTSGSRKCYECSNRGICDRSTKTCKCEKYFQSSGGYDPTKNEIVSGTRGDCSYYQSYRKVVDKEEEEI